MLIRQIQAESLGSKVPGLVHLQKMPTQGEIGLMKRKPKEALSKNRRRQVTSRSEISKMIFPIFVSISLRIRIMETKCHSSESDVQVNRKEKEEPNEPG